MPESNALVSSEGMDLVENVLSTGRELTTKEVDLLSNAYIACTSIGHWCLLALFEGKAHKASGSAKFEDFARERLGVTISDRSIHNYLCRARVERNLGQKLQNLQFLKPQVGLEAAIELNKLPADEQPAAWKEAMDLKRHGTLLPAQIARALRGIVARRLNQSEHQSKRKALPAAPAFVPDLRSTSQPVVIEPVETMKPREPVKPIVPPTYDRGPEFDDEQPAAEQDPIPEAPAPVIAPPPVVEVPSTDPSPQHNVVTRFQYDALLTITKAFAGAVDRADKDAAIEARVDFKNFLKEWGP